MAQTKQQATNITERINVLYPVPNVDINYGPYESVLEAYTTLYNNEAIAIGLTVGIQESGSNTIQEYWFNGGTTEEHLVKKLAEEGITSYNDLDDKPSINNQTLVAGTSLTDIGAASASTLSSHTSNEKIHTPITYNGTTTAVTGIKLEGEKLTFTVGANEYSFRLTEWHDVADFYILFAKISYSNGAYYANINGTDVAYDSLTSEQLLSMAVLENGNPDQYGYTVKSAGDKETLTLHDNTAVSCDYIIRSANMPQHKNAVLVMYRTSGISLPSLNKFVWTGSLDNGYYYNSDTSVDQLKTYLQKSDIVTEFGRYGIKAWYSQTVESFDLDFGINFTKN